MSTFTFKEPTHPPDSLLIYWQDRSHLLRIFPEEVWQDVLDKVINADTLEKISNSSTYLRELLLTERVHFLFPSVWKVLINCGYYSCTAGSDYRLEYNSKLNELFKLRLVSRSWNQAIDNFYQHHNDHFRLDQHRHAPDDNVVNMSRVYIAEYEADPVGNFHYLFDSSYLSSGRNPFFGRSISFEISDNDSINHAEESQLILDMYGHHIWHCRLNIWDTFRTVTDCYSRIRAALEQLPNMKTLHITFFTNGEVRTSSELRELDPEMQLNPLPKFENLKMLSTDSTILPIFYELLRRNSHISTLAVHHKDVRVDYNIHSVPLPNLKTLSITFNKYRSFLEAMNSHVDWSLVTELHLRLNWTATAAQWQKVFNALRNRFQNSLLKLNLTLPEVVVKKQVKKLLTATYKLDLPNLTHLQLSMTNLANLDFLLPMRNSLLVLHLDVQLSIFQRVDELMKKLETGKGKVIKLFSCKHYEYDTNIWTILPKLKEFHVNFHSYATMFKGPTTSNNVNIITFKLSSSREEWEIKVKTKCSRKIYFKHD